MTFMETSLNFTFFILSFGYYVDISCGLYGGDTFVRQTRADQQVIGQKVVVVASFLPTVLPLAAGFERGDHDTIKHSHLLACWTMPLWLWILLLFPSCWSPLSK